jgi:hypothetical protein
LCDYAGDYLPAFKAKLAEARIDNPHEAILESILLYDITRLQAAVQPSTPSWIARQLYEDAKVKPGQTTCCVIQEELHISLNGPWSQSRPCLTSGVDGASHRPIVLKMLPTHEFHLRQAANAEEAAITKLQLKQRGAENGLVPAEIVTVRVPASESKTVGTGPGQRCAVKMPW